MGRPPAIEEEELKSLLENRDKPALTTGDIADAFDCNRKTAHKHLKKLERAGELDSYNMSQADAWCLSKSDPVVSLDGGDLLSLKKWFYVKWREFYPGRALAQAIIAGVVAWFFADLAAGLVAAVAVFLTVPAIILLVTLLLIRVVKPRLSASETTEKTAV